MNAATGTTKKDTGTARRKGDIMATKESKRIKTARRKELKRNKAEFGKLMARAKKQKKKFQERGYGTEAIDKLLSISPWTKGYTARDYTFVERNAMYKKAIAQLKWKMNNSFTYTIKGYEENMKSIAESMGLKFSKSRKKNGKWTGPQFTQMYEDERGIRHRASVSSTTMSKFFDAFHNYLSRHPEAYDDSDRIKRNLHRFAVEMGANDGTDQDDINMWLSDRIDRFLEEDPGTEWNPDIDLW